MSKEKKLNWTEIGDTLALKIQEWRKSGKVDDEQPLLRIDYRKEAAQAPFQFDIVNGKLHRTVCTAIPNDARSAVYAVWKPTKEDIKLGCKRCRPDSNGDERVNKDLSSDILMGFLSILDQFGSVLTERGKEYRDSERGKAVEKTIRTILSRLDQKEQEVLDGLLSSLDVLVKVVQGCNESIRHNGHGLNARKRAGQQGPGKKSRKRNDSIPRQEISEKVTL